MPLPLFPLYQVSHSCSSGMHKQTARAQGRSSTAPPIVGAFVPQASALRRARALSTGSSRGRGSMRRLAPRSVSQTTPPQHRAPPDTDSRRHGLSNSAAPAARKRSASASLQARCARVRSLRGLSAGSASPLSGSRFGGNGGRGKRALNDKAHRMADNSSIVV